MRRILLCGIAAATLMLAGCAAGSGDDPVAPGTPTDGSPSASDGPATGGGDLQHLPAPSADSPVLAIATVLEQGGDALLCVGAVAESAPPQCSGPVLVGWDWDAYEHVETGGVRWVQGVAVEGTYDAEAQTFTQTGEPQSAAAITLPAVEVPAGDLDDAEIESITAELMGLGRDDLFAAWGERGTVVLEAVYDDGSIQAALDDIYGTGAVLVISALR